jgi:hypothetical protein
MTKYVLSSSVLALVLAAPAIASAQSAPAGTGCPPGSWFCSGTQDATPPAAPSQQLQTLPDPDEAPPPPPPPHRRPTVTYSQNPYDAPPPPPAVVYQPPPPPMLVRPEAPPPYEYRMPRPKPVTPPHEWGINLHLEGADIGSGVEHNAGMGGGGVGLRFKPSRYFGIESDLDFVGGHGYVGDVRHEEALTFNALFFLNPRSRAQIYLLAGFGWSWANSQNDPNDPSVTTPYNNNYAYFGGQAGIGLELRLTRVLAFNVDFRGFVRTRTDSLASSQPEFTNSAGQTTNTSGGGLFTGGLTLYF